MKTLLVLLIFIINLTNGFTQVNQSKYGPLAKRLFLNRDFIKNSPALDFWALMPYYMPQFTGKSCSVASAAMVLNALRARIDLTSKDKLITQENLLKKVNSSEWSFETSENGHGVSLNVLSKHLVNAFQFYDLKNRKAEVIYFKDTSSDSKRKLLAILRLNEKSDLNFILANFLQSEFTSDPEGAVGHFSPVGAFDEKNEQVLIFDVDRLNYEPYWVSVDTFLKGIATSTGTRFRGLIYVSDSK